MGCKHFTFTREIKKGRVNRRGRRTSEIKGKKKIFKSLSCCFPAPVKSDNGARGAGERPPRCSGFPACTHTWPHHAHLLNHPRKPRSSSSPTPSLAAPVRALRATRVIFPMLEHGELILLGKKKLSLLLFQATGPSRNSGAGTWRGLHNVPGGNAIPAPRSPSIPL